LSEIVAAAGARGSTAGGLLDQRVVVFVGIEPRTTLDAGELFEFDGHLTGGMAPAVEDVVKMLAADSQLLRQIFLITAF